MDRAGRVLVQPDLTIPGRHEVYVIGDLAAFRQRGRHAAAGRRAGGHAAGAVHAAANIVRTLDGGSARQPFVYVNLGNLATIGRARAIADLPRLRFSGSLAWLFWLFVHIMQLTGFRNRIVVLVQWAFAYFTYQRSIRLITGQEARIRLASSSR